MQIGQESFQIEGLIGRYLKKKGSGGMQKVL